VLGAPLKARMGVPLRIAVAVWIVIALGGARTAAARGEHPVCKFSPQLAMALYQAHPEADLDGDGVLSRTEACDLQSELRRAVQSAAAARSDSLRMNQESKLDPDAEAELKSLLEQPLCCNCDPGEAYSSPEVASCQGADR
jgi:hypothetical protein